ncbi:MAG: hypothetical protein J6S63_12295, partial [Atopobiaceae bacterium]|nr:hypothetical protein [Atopobiaceae bacterium]
MKKMDVHATARKVVAFALTGIIATSSLYPAALAYAAPSSSEIERQLKAAEQRLDALEQQLNQTEAELGKTNFELDQTRANIAELEQNISVNEGELAEAKSRLSIVIGESYRQGGEMSLLDLVLNSESLDDFVSRVYYANKVVEKKNKEINTVAGLQSELLADKSMLEEQQRAQESLLAEQQSQYEAMQDAASGQAVFIEQLSSEVVEAMESERRAAAQASLKAARDVLGDDFVNAAFGGQPAPIEAFVQPTDESGDDGQETVDQDASAQSAQESEAKANREEQRGTRDDSQDAQSSANQDSQDQAPAQEQQTQQQEEAEQPKQSESQSTTPASNPQPEPE